MAHSFGAFAVPDAHITFLAAHPGSVHDYREGVPPKNLAADQVPDWWPNAECESLGGWSINHRNTDLYHWILNGGPELVTHAGSIFQTWYTDTHGAIGLDPHNERFAFLPGQLPELRPASFVRKATPCRNPFSQSAIPRAQLRSSSPC